MCDTLQVMDGEIIFAVTLQTGCEQSKSTFVKDREEDAAVIEKCLSSEDQEFKAALPLKLTLVVWDAPYFQTTQVLPHKNV